MSILKPLLTWTKRFANIFQKGKDCKLTFFSKVIKKLIPAITIQTKSCNQYYFLSSLRKKRQWMISHHFVVCGVWCAFSRGWWELNLWAPSNGHEGIPWCNSCVIAGVKERTMAICGTLKLRKGRKLLWLMSYCRNEAFVKFCQM